MWKQGVLFCATIAFGVFLPSATQSGCSYKSLGCWKDTSNRTIPTLEGTDNRLAGNYWQRNNATEVCFQVAKSKDYRAFAVQNGGWCAGSSTALSTYKKYGISTDCKDGKGGSWANDVYQITCDDSGPSNSCKLTPKDQPGPFYVKKKYTLETKCIAFSRDNPLPGKCDDDEYLKEPIRIQGRVLDSRCRPIAGAIMEYWQAAPEWSVSHKNVYTMVDSSCTGGCIDTQNLEDLKKCEARQEPDCIIDMKYKAYRGWQKTTKDGSYQLNTVRPGIYNIRPIRHIHVKITVPDQTELVTQLYLPQDKPTEQEDLYTYYKSLCEGYEKKPEQWAKKQDLVCPIRNDPEGARDIPNMTTYNWDVVLNI